ncbi:MAG: outer membrane beta-barrel protein [Gemmatimonadetes bacterium]|nr:outer membrane beta-barrel protein [Gemmatimonadota bacterium]
MRRASPWMAALAILMGSTGVAGQDLPPDIQVDLYLVRADRLIESRDYTAALEALDVVLALQARHGLDTPTDLWFRHGQVALQAGYAQTAIASSTRYLQEAGREGAHYTAALELLDEAQALAAGRERPAPAPVPAVVAAEPQQPDVPERAAVNRFTLISMLGVNGANMAFGSEGPIPFDPSQLAGLAGGVAVVLPIGVVLSGVQIGAQLGAQYSQKGARMDLGDEEVTADARLEFQYVDFTALARIYPARAHLPLYLLAGGYGSLEVACRLAVDVGAGTERISASDDCISDQIDIETRPFDFGLSGGVGFEMGTGATRPTIGFLYSHGLQDIDKYAGETASHRVLNIHVGFATTF